MFGTNSESHLIKNSSENVLFLERIPFPHCPAELAVTFSGLLIFIYAAVFQNKIRPEDSPKHNLFLSHLKHLNVVNIGKKFLQICTITIQLEENT